MPDKPKLYRITSEGTTYIGFKEEVNKLPDAFKQLFIKAMKQAAEGKTPDPFSVPPTVLREAGFTPVDEFERQRAELEEPDEEDDTKEVSPPPKRQPKSGSSKSFVDILAEKIADKILDKLLGG